MAELSDPTKELIQKYQSWHQSLRAGENTATIHVDEVASKVAAFYEKIRGVVEWREEHLMRKTAIERILKRRLFMPKEEDQIADSLVLELIRGGHFPNDRIPESKIKDVQRSLNKYIHILNNRPENGSLTEKQKISLYDWILGIAAAEVEDILAPAIREKALIEYMEVNFAANIQLPKNISISENEKKFQVYVAIQRSLFKLDDSTISYNLLKRTYSGWNNIAKNDDILNDITKNIYSIWNNIEKILNHKLNEKFYQICEQYDTPYLIIGDIVSESPMQVGQQVKDPVFLESKITEVYKKRLISLKTRLKRAAIYATLSIFITKILLAVAVEVPFDKYITGDFNYFVIGLNIAIPVLLMFFLILTIRTPGDTNFQKVMLEVMKIMHQKENTDVYQIKMPRKQRGAVMNFAIALFYLITYVLAFGAIIYVLRYFHFGVASIVIFLIFISLISFAGTKIRKRSQELQITKPKESGILFFVDIFALPILMVGKWLSGQFSRFNIVVIFFNFLIDMPLQRFIEFLEQWRDFLREKKGKIH